MKQHTVALSTASAEYVCDSEATTQAVWLRFVLEDFGEVQTDATTLYCDNQSTTAMTKNPVFHQRFKTHSLEVSSHHRCIIEQHN